MRIFAGMVPASVLALGLASCGPTTISPDTRNGLLSVFSGFIYSGELDDERPDSAQLKGGPLPDRLVSGKTYVFHHRKPYDEGIAFAQNIVPSRLSKIGLAMTKGINESQGPVEFSTGAAWYVKFAGSHCVGTISRDVDGVYLKWPWNQMGIEPGMYLLKVAGDCPA